MTMIHTWKWILIFSLEHLQAILQVILLFKIDTRADTSVTPEVVFKHLQGVTLNLADRHLIGPGQNQLEVSGQFTAKLMRQNSVADEQIYVVKQLQKSLLGRSGILALDLIARTHALQEMDKFVVRFPKLFQGLGTIQDEYHISLQEGAKPLLFQLLEEYHYP